MKPSEETSPILEMVGLYQKDPEAFEKRRTEMIRDMIEELPEEYRRLARGMQFQLEMRLKRYQDPLVRMNAMIGMFWEQFDRFNRALNDPREFLAEQEAKRGAPAKVLPLKRPSTRH